MRPSHFTLLAGALLLTGQARGFGQTASPGTQPPTQGTPAPPAPPASNPQSLALLDAAIQKLSRPEGVDVRFRLEVFGRTEPVVTTGRAVTAANRRVSIEMEARQVARTAKVRLLCDGEHFYRIESVGGKNSLLSYGVKELQESLERLATTEAERVAKEDVERIMQGRHGFEGAAALVRDLRGRMDFDVPQVTTATVNGKLVGVKLVQGQWSKEVLDIIAPTTKPDPNSPVPRELWNDKQAPYFNIPRLARFYFDSASGDLLRVELVGIREKQGPETILTAVHFDSVTPLSKLDETLFKPTSEELAYPKQDVNLQALVRSQHQEMMRQLKMLQDFQNQTATGAGK